MKKREDFIYTRDKLGYPPWEPIMNTMIKTIDDYMNEDNNYANNLRITYVKDKYGRLRCEYYWWDEYTNSLIESVEDLSYYIK